MDQLAEAATIGAGLMEEPGEELSDGKVLLFISISAGLVVMAGLMSGLTIGLMAMDEIEMEVLKRGGTPTEQKYAAAIAPLLKNHHFLLCTLVVWNAAAMEALPIFLDRLADPVTAVALSVTVVLIFGEIVPQSICTRYGLAVGYYASWLLRFLMVISFPIAWPLGKLLDVILGHSAATLPRGQLQQYVALHGEDEGFAALGEALTRNETQIINSALELTAKTARAAMTPLDNVFMVSADAMLDEELAKKIIQVGHSRVPVHAPGDRTSILGLLLVKELVLVKEPTPVSQLKVRSLPALSASMPMWDVLQLFKIGRAHMAVLCEAPEVEKEAARKMLEARGFPKQAYAHSESFSLGGGTAEELLAKRAEVCEAPADAAVGMAVEDLQDMFINSTIGAPVGIITIEDVIEELLGDEIIDETDRFVDNLKTSKVDPSTLHEHLPKNLRTLLNWGSFIPRGNSGRRSLSDWHGASQPLVDAEGGECVLWRSRPGTPVRAGDGTVKIMQGPFVSSFASPLRQQAVVAPVADEEAVPLLAEGAGSSTAAAPGAAVSAGGQAPSAKAIGDAITKIEHHFQSNPELSDAIVTLQEATNMSAFASAVGPPGTATAEAATTATAGTGGPAGSADWPTRPIGQGPGNPAVKSLIATSRAAAVRRSASNQLREKHLRALEQRSVDAPTPPAPGGSSLRTPSTAPAPGPPTQPSANEE